MLLEQLIENPVLPERARIIRVLTREFCGEFTAPNIQDAADEGYTKWYEAVECGEVRELSSRPAYVFHCARNYLFRLIRRKVHELPMSEVTCDCDTMDGPDAERIAKGEVNYLFSKLPGPWKQVMQLFWIEGFEIQEIAERMPRSKKAVYHLKEKAEKRFAEIGIKELGYPPCKNHSIQNKNNSKKS